MDLSSFRLDDRVAVVIGGTGVLCGRMATTLAMAGARTVIVGRDVAKADEALQGMPTDAADITFERCDVVDRIAVRHLVERVLASHGRIDVLVNGAGVNSATPFLDIDDDEMDRIVATNQHAVMRSCQEFGRYFTDRATRTGEGASTGMVAGIRCDCAAKPACGRSSFPMSGSAPDTSTS